jgi:uncharacterized protein (DUF1501 family)
MLALGGGGKGWKVHGRWPGLDAEHLFDGRDVAVTTDLRDVFSEVLGKGMAVASTDTIFPGYAPKRVGVL